MPIDGEHVAKGDTFDEALASTIDFTVWLVGCDECVAYIRDDSELVPWVWKHSMNRSVEQSRLSIHRGYAAALAEHRQPIAIAEPIAESPRIKDPSAWSTDPGETFVSIPLLARSKLFGAIDLKHHRPHAYSCREFKLLSSLGYLLGADIGISQLKKENSDLILQLETRKLIERGKGSLQRDQELSQEDAYLGFQRQSWQKRFSIKGTAQAIM